MSDKTNVSVSKLMAYDLKNSGLSISDMRTRPLGGPESTQIGLSPETKGYVIPYYSISGKPLEYYRTKLFESHLPKYMQIKDTPNHVYFPRHFWTLLERTNFKYVIITEGEKKAALAVKLGFPCVGLGGVDSWRNRGLILPANTALSKSKAGNIVAKLPSGTDMRSLGATGLAVGLQELIDLCVERSMDAVVVFDSDNEIGVRSSVQRAASTLGFEMRYRGIPHQHIHQVFLPTLPDPSTLIGKVGLDDYLIFSGKKSFEHLLNEAFEKERSTFPVHPNTRELMNKKLGSGGMSRKQYMYLAMCVLSDLDANGQRLYSKKEEQLYYFSYLEKTLLKVTMGNRSYEAFQDTSFAQFLYRKYGITGSDQKLLGWIGTLFAGEAPISEVHPYRVYARPDDRRDENIVRMQINNSQYIEITGDEKAPIAIRENGYNKILFEADQIEPLDAYEVEVHFRRLLMSHLEKKKNNPKYKLSSWWDQVLNEVRLKDHGPMQTLLAYFYYMSPFLYRWRGTQIPVEMVLGEPGSGKSSLCELRLQILTGATKLRNAPSDIKDWHASIASVGGLHVTDNVVLQDKTLRQRISDEICRLVTESRPSVEMRKLYSNGELIEMDINSVFSFTAIKQPFQNADLLQRTLIVSLDKGVDNVWYDSNWKQNQIEKFGGREAWLGHHMLVLHEFFKLMPKEWNDKYRAKNRLVNLEQMFMVMAKVFGDDGKWIPEFLSNLNYKLIAKNDWVMEGLKEFARYLQKEKDPQKKYSHRFTVKEIADWMSCQQEFEENHILTNSRSLGHYIAGQQNLVATIAGLEPAGKRNNRAVYRLKDKRQ